MMIAGGESDGLVDDVVGGDIVCVELLDTELVGNTSAARAPRSDGDDDGVWNGGLDDVLEVAMSDEKVAWWSWVVEGGTEGSAAVASVRAVVFGRCAGMPSPDDAELLHWLGGEAEAGSIRGGLFEDGGSNKGGLLLLMGGKGGN